MVTVEVGEFVCGGGALAHGEALYATMAYQTHLPRYPPHLR